MAECAGRAAADGLCGNARSSGTKAAIAALVCVGVLEVAVVAAVIFCRIRNKRRAVKESSVAKQKKPILTLRPVSPTPKEPSQPQDASE